MIDPDFSKRLDRTKSFGIYRMEMINENTRAKGCTSRRGVKGRLSWALACQQSAPVGLELSPPSLESILKRIDLGKMMIDLVFLPNAFFEPEVLVSTEWRCWMKTHVQRDVEVEEVSKKGSVGLWLATCQHLWVWNGSLQALKTV